MMLLVGCCPCWALLLVLLLLVGHYLVCSAGGGIGINYGQIGDNLPSPNRVVPLVRSIGASKVKLYDADPTVLKAFSNTGVEVMVCIPNDLLPKIKADPKEGSDWVRKNVKSYLPATNITSIVVGNEILAVNDSSLSRSLLPALRSVQSAVSALGLEGQVSVTTTHSLSELSTSYPPSAGAFRSDLADCISDILDFNNKTGSPFLINAYPFFAYKASPKQIPLDFVLFQPNQGVVDPSSGLHYPNMLFAQIDAVYSAVASLGYKSVPVHISETGWPSKGDDDEVGATPDNAKKYNGNLLKLMADDDARKDKGTPMRPDSDLSIFLFALFNENLKPGPTSERNYGLFKPDGTPAYQLLGIQTKGNATSLGPTGGGGGGGSSSGSADAGPPTSTEDSSSSSSSTGYLSISAAHEVIRGRPSSPTILIITLLLLLSSGYLRLP